MSFLKQYITVSTVFWLCFVVFSWHRRALCQTAWSFIGFDTLFLISLGLNCNDYRLRRNYVGRYAGAARRQVSVTSGVYSAHCGRWRHDDDHVGWAAVLGQFPLSSQRDPVPQTTRGVFTRYHSRSLHCYWPIRQQRHLCHWHCCSRSFVYVSSFSIVLHFFLFLIMCFNVSTCVLDYVDLICCLLTNLLSCLRTWIYFSLASDF